MSGGAADVLVERLGWMLDVYAGPLGPDIPEGDTLTRLLWLLEYISTADEVPPCRVCGGELSVQRAGGGERTKYGHAKPDDVTFRDWMDHYRESEWYPRREGDEKVLALVQCVRDLSRPGQATS